MSGWPSRVLADVLIRTETTDPTQFPSSEFDYVDVSSVSNETLAIEETQRLKGKDAPSRARRLIKTNDILFATIRPTLRRIAIVPNEFDGQVCSTGYFVLRASPQIDNRFVFYFLQTESFMSEMERLQKGASYPAVTDGDVRSQKIPVPPLSEQRRIVALLDEAFAHIATAKANTEKGLQKVRAVDASHRQSLLLGSPWPQTTLDCVAKNLDSRRIPITKSDRKPGKFPYYGASGIVDYVADYIFDGDALLVSEDGANLLARSTPIAFSATGKYWVNNHAHILQFDDMATQKFVEFFLESIPLDDYITGAAQPKLNQKALNSIPVPFPPNIEERVAVVEQVEAMKRETDRLQSLYTRKLAALDELKQSLLHQAFSGQL